MTTKMSALRERTVRVVKVTLETIGGGEGSAQSVDAPSLSESPSYTRNCAGALSSSTSNTVPTVRLACLGTLARRWDESDHREPGSIACERLVGASRPRNESEETR